MTRPEIRRILSRRRQPSGLVSLRYLWPGNDPRVRRHRTFWWGPVMGRGRRCRWLAIQALLWLRWILWSGWREMALTLRSNRDVAFPLRHRLAMLRLTLGWCVSPWEAWTFGLLPAPGRALDFVFEAETNGYHAWRNRLLGLSTSQIDRTARRLNDKLSAAETLQAANIPVVPTIACVAAGTAPPLRTLLATGEPVFCKTRGGNRGRGAFAACLQGDSIRGETFKGRPLPDADAVEDAWRNLTAIGDVLIQPMLSTHPDLAPLSADQSTITLRHVTVRDGSDIRDWQAVLEIPGGLRSNGTRGYLFLPVDLASGRLRPFPPDRMQHPQARKAQMDLEAKLSPKAEVPFWQTLRDASHRAHALFPDAGSIAWDWVIAPDGPVLLEGNTGWGLHLPQQIAGGLLHDLPDADTARWPAAGNNQPGR